MGFAKPAHQYQKTWRKLLVFSMKSTFSSYKEPIFWTGTAYFSNQIFQKVAGMPDEGIIV